MEKIIDNYSISGNVLKREIILKVKENLVKIKVDRNCNNYNANINVVVIDKEQLRQVDLLHYYSEELINKDLSYKDLNRAIQLNNEDLERVYKDIEKVML